MEDLPGLKSAIATVLRRVQREARLSQQKLADFAGLSRIHIAQLEGRRQNATLNVLLLIAMALNLDGLSLLRMIHEEMLRTGHGRKAERQDEPHQEALPKETGKQSPSPPE
jgi:transcriptional regulator with XRE-family HTH domain